MTDSLSINNILKPNPDQAHNAAIEGSDSPRSFSSEPNIGLNPNIEQSPFNSPRSQFGNGRGGRAG